MSRTFVLVDFENVQPQNLGVLKAGPCQIKVFLGASQSKISLELARALQSFGSDAEYIQIVGSGSNALDFHIAFYIGRLAAEHPDAQFVIVSRDTGFDPLVKHLGTLGIACRRVKAITEVVPPAHVTAPVKAVAKTPRAAHARQEAAPAPARVPAKKAAPLARTRRQVPQAQVEEVLARLRKLRGRPGTVKTLGSSVASWIKPAPTEAELAALLAHLARTGRITISGTKVAYTLD